HPRPRVDHGRCSPRKWTVTNHRGHGLPTPSHLSILTAQPLVDVVPVLLGLTGGGRQRLGRRAGRGAGEGNAFRPAMAVGFPCCRRPPRFEPER
uniref:Uncharacterized protein n=1 Tax=Triticum urartu TaxID=4572 RepID=A0A8R7TT20_TRIUA